MSTKTMLLEFCSQPGLPYQKPAVDYAKKLLEPYGAVSVSPLGSVLCTVKQPEEGQPHVLLDAHLDEIGFFVTFIEEDGFLRLGQVGGTDPRLLSATRVTIHTKTKEVVGVIASIPPHLSDGQNPEALPADKVYVDVGMTKEIAERIIAPGDPVTFHHAPVELLNNLVSAKAMDDRAGCIALVKALEKLDGEIPCGLTVVFSAMEEVGGMGAQTSVYDIRPTHALAVDVSFATTPDAPPKVKAQLGEGPMIGIAPVLDKALSDRLIQLAKEQDIPFQYEVMGGRTGTNVDALVTSRGGVPSALLSIPLRYMHMPVETVSIDDIEATGKLIAGWIQDLGKGEDQ